MGDSKSCKQFQAGLTKKKDEISKLLEAKQKNGERMIQICRRCGNGVQKSEACDHMTCKCGHGFCYLCGEDWKGHSGSKCMKITEREKRKRTVDKERDENKGGVDGDLHVEQNVAADELSHCTDTLC